MSKQRKKHPISVNVNKQYRCYRKAVSRVRYPRGSRIRVFYRAQGLPKTWNKRSYWYWALNWVSYKYPEVIEFACKEWNKCN